MIRFLIILLVLLTSAVVFTGCSDDCDTATPPVTIPDLDYAGSDKCMACHQDHYDRWVKSGHPFKLTKIEGESPDLLFPAESMFPNDPVVPPAGYTWADISYTIGGFGWKMRWIDENGYIITLNDDTQYNFENQTRVAYTSDPIGTKKYNCGKCHTTGWVDSDDGDATNNQDGLEGLVGTFFAGGIHCEQCHGMGSRHVAAPQDFAMTKDSSSALCGQCHTRDPENRIAGSGGYIKHHEQYDEWLHSPHNSAIGCNTCHDPHSSVKLDDVMPGDGTAMSCTDCHTTYAGANLKHGEFNGFVTCTSCHMPKASKSAIAVTAYQGDIKTHIFSINSAAVGKDEMFTEDGKFVRMDEVGQAAVTLDFACYGCHNDPDGVGGGGSIKTLQELSDFVTGADGNGPMHPQPPTLAGR
ncbi:MAG: multiheme c-type cytochrome [Candidatus Krumholzibacteriota bacterium]